MRILIVASTMVHIKNFHIPYIERMKQQGHEVFVMASGEGADFQIPFEKKTLSLKNLRLVSKIKKILKSNSFDRALLHTTLAAFYVRLAMKGMKNRPYVINTVHGYLFSKDSSFFKKRVYLACEKILRKQTDAIAVMNSEDYEIAQKNKLCLGNVYKINGMGISFQKQKFEKEQLGYLRLTFVGELSKRKNQAFLLRSLSELPNAYLTLVGDGAEREKLEKYAKKHGLQNRFCITGFTKNVRSYLEKTDVYVSASTIEGLPFNIMEAMCLGLPIVASDVKGQNDLLEKDSLYELNNLQAFVNAVKNTALEKREYETDKYKLESVLDNNMKIYLG